MKHKVRIASIFLVTTASISATYADIDEDLVVHYDFNGSYNDLTSNKNDPQIHGDIQFVEGREDQGIYINNPPGNTIINQYLTIPYSASISDIENKSFTMNICYKTTDSSKNNGRLFGTVGNGRLVIDYNSGNKPNAYSLVNDGVNQYYVGFNEENNPKAIVTDGKFHCESLVLNRDTNKLSQFIDGYKIDETDVGTIGNIPMSSMILGATKLGDVSGAKDTTIDDFRIYNRALSVAEIRSLSSGYNYTGEYVDSTSLDDINGNGYPEIAVLRINKNNGNNTVYIKDANTKELINKINFLSFHYIPNSISSLNDINSNGFAELSVLGVHRETGKAVTQIRDSSTGVKITNINFQKQ